jgi:hypothetical protein
MSFASRGAHTAAVKPAKLPCETADVSRPKVSVAYRRDNQVADERVCLINCLLDAGWIGAVGDIQQCCD